MILRKPYAFLIKHFKLIHTVLSLAMLYLLYQTYNINSFFSDFKAMGDLKAEANITDKLFNDYMFFIPWVIIVIALIILGVMIKKSKPKFYYLVNIASNIVTIALYSYLYNTILYMETNIISGQLVNLANDLVFMLLLIQLATVVTPIMRAIGLDLKKFDFGKDLLELEIDEEDNEEVEINVDFETNVAARKINKSKRFLKYFYLENMLVVNIVAVILAGTIGYVVYINVNVYSARYKQGDNFNTGDTMVNVLSAYTTNQNSKGSVISKDGKTLVILKTRLSRSGSEYFNTAKAQLYIGGKHYYPVKDYAKKIGDLGVNYKDDRLTYEPTIYLLVYEIPNDLLNKKMYFRYMNEIDVKSSKIDAKYIRVKLKPLALEQDVTKEEIKLNEEFVINKDVMGNTKVTLTDVSMAKEFKIPYKFCLSKAECHDSVEYIRPLLNTNYDKALIKVEGKIELDETINIKAIKNIYNVITYFGKVKYVKDDKSYIINTFTKVESKKVDKTGVYYLEVDRSILDADEVYLILKSRNYEYQYTLKTKEVAEENQEG